MLNPEKNTPCFFTQQLFLIGTYDKDGSPRFAPISWISYTEGEPSCLVISMYGTKKTKENITRTGLLSATVVTPDLLPLVEYNNDSTKEEESPVAVVSQKGNELKVPLIAEAKFSYECKIIKTVEIGLCHTYFAEIHKVNVREDINKLDFYDLRVIDPVIYSPFNYFTVGEHIGKIGDYSKKEKSH